MSVSKTVSNPVQSLLFPLSLLCVMYVCGWTASRTLRQYVQEPDTFGTQKVYARKAVTSLLGEFRGSLAGFLYNRGHEYLHGGVLMRATTDSEAMQGAGANSEGEVCAIPDAAHDYRGIWGDIERDTSPFTHFHRDRARVQLLPLYRLMTWSDPHFIEGYSLGSYLVFSCATDRPLERAMDFLREGVDNNPNSYVLHGDLGEFELNNLHHIERSQQQFLLAVRAIESMSPAQFKALDDAEREQARQAWELLVITYRRQHNRPCELAWARKGLKHFPDSVTCRRSLTSHAYSVRASKGRRSTAAIPR